MFNHVTGEVSFATVFMTYERVGRKLDTSAP